MQYHETQHPELWLSSPHLPGHHTAREVTNSWESLETIYIYNFFLIFDLDISPKRSSGVATTSVHSPQEPVIWVVFWQAQRLLSGRFVHHVGVFSRLDLYTGCKYLVKFKKSATVSSPLVPAALSASFFSFFFFFLVKDITSFGNSCFFPRISEFQETLQNSNHISGTLRSWAHDIFIHSRTVKQSI